MTRTHTDHGDPEQIRQLVEKARQGSREALGELLENYRTFLRGVAYHELAHDLRTKEESIDLVQETLLKAQRDFGGFQGATEEQLRAWLPAILRHCVLEFVRRYRSAGRDVDREEPLGDDARPLAHGQLPRGAGTPYRNAVREERVSLLTSALSRVSERDRTVVRLAPRGRLHVRGDRPAPRLLGGRRS